MLLTNSNVNAIIPHVWLTLSSNLPRRTLGIRPLLAPPELQPPRHSDLPTFHLAIFFRIRTYEKTVRNSFRIRTYKTRHLKSFRIRTYKKRPGGVGPESSPHRPDFPAPTLAVRDIPFRRENREKKKKEGTLNRAPTTVLSADQKRRVERESEERVSSCGDASRRCYRGLARRDRRGPSSRK